MFNRQPRLRTPLSAELVKIPAPPNIPAPPSGVSWLTIGLPLIATLLSVVLMLSVVGGSTALSFLIFIPIMVATALASVLQAWLQKRDYRKQIAAAQQEYSAELQQLMGKLQAMWQAEQQLRIRNDPDFDMCLKQAESQAARLGERRPTDNDFLSVRIGTGAIATAFRVEAPDVNPRPREFANHLVLADQIVKDYEYISKCPLVLPLRNHSGIGFVGARQEVMPVVRALVAHTATYHWLSEVQFLVIAPQQARTEWQFLATLPHGREWWSRGAASSPNGPSNAERLASLEAELQKRQQLVYANQLKSGGAADKPLMPYLIVVVDHVHTTPTSPALKLLLEKGRELGAVALFTGERLTDVPSDCSAVVQVNAASLRYSATGPEGRTWHGDADGVNLPSMDRLANALARIDWLREEDVSQPPDKVTFLNLLGADSLDQLDVFSWWEGNYPYGYLRAPIGKTSRDAELIFDLNDTDGAHGPHGLIGGMTGSGKSELLRTIVLALALTHHPYDLNFALIDYKGGATFNDLDQLPHTVGVITDIETYASYGERVILSLTAEIERRKRLVEQAKTIFGFGRSHIDEYRKLPVRRPLPRLVVIFDEFASFKQKHPEESKMLIDIARQGRSLGVHMILATQNPRSAVDDQVRQNSTFRIALRVSEPSDSNELIGIPDAAFLSRGRAYFFVRAPQLFQIAFGGAPYFARKLPDDAIVRILPNNRREILYPLDWNASAPLVPNAIQDTESQAILARILSVAETMGIQKLAPVWQEPLPERLYLPQVLNDVRRTSWDGIQWVPLEEVTPMVVIGRRDEPARQRQEYELFNPMEQGGHVLIFGSPGTGKSVLLQTIALSLAMSHTPEEVNLYIADLAGQPVLSALAPLPHVGAVIRPSESERIDRLFKLLRAEIERRSELLRQVGTLAAYNNAFGDKRIPYIFVLVDDFGKLKTDYSEHARELGRLANEGRPLGIYFIITANSDDDLFADLMSNISYKLSFKQAAQTRYTALVGYVSEQRAENEFGPQTRPGRGLLRGNPPLLFQAALPTTGANDAEQNVQLSQTVQAMRQAWRGVMPPRVRALRRLIPLAEFASRDTDISWRLNGSGIGSYTAPIGQEYDSLRPCEIELGSDGQIFMVISLNPRLGKTTALRVMALSLAERYSPDQLNLVFFDQHKRTAEALNNLPHTLPTPRRKEQVPRIIEKLRAEVERRRTVLQNSGGELTDARLVSAIGPALVLFIDDYPDFMNEFAGESNLQKDLLDILNWAREVNVYLVLSGNLGEMPGDFQDPLLRRARSDGSGILLSSREGIDSYKNARLPQPTAEFPPGRGYFVRRGQPRLIQVATYYGDKEKPNEAAAIHVQRIAASARQQNLQAQWHPALSAQETKETLE